MAQERDRPGIESAPTCIGLSEPTPQLYEAFGNDGEDPQPNADLSDGSNDYDTDDARPFPHTFVHASQEEQISS